MAQLFTKPYFKYGSFISLDNYIAKKTSDVGKKIYSGADKINPYKMAITAHVHIVRIMRCADFHKILVI